MFAVTKSINVGLSKNVSDVARKDGSVEAEQLSVAPSQTQLIWQLSTNEVEVRIGAKKQAPNFWGNELIEE